MPRTSIVPFALAVLGLTPLMAQGSKQSESDDLQSLLELLNTPVVSASRTAEKLSSAPATVIVISRSDIAKRGYTDVSQMLNDLPGMQVVRPFGDSQVKNYWRGYRSFIGDPYLLMVNTWRIEPFGGPSWTTGTLRAAATRKTSSGPWIFG